MNKFKFLRGAVLGGGATASLAASLCCVSPFIAMGLGATGAMAAAALEKWRFLFLSLAFVLLSLAWYITYRRPKPVCGAEATSTTGLRSRASKPMLWCATGVVLIAAAFPTLSSTFRQARARATCCALAEVGGGTTPPATEGAKAAPRHIPPSRVSLYAVPLVCPVAPQIGCGSHAKPVLLLLEGQPAVAQAWLNHHGTEIAVVWKPAAKPEERAAAVNAVRSQDSLDMRELQGPERKRALRDFLSGGDWLRGREVDRLSAVEAGVMAARLVRRIRARVSLPEAQAQALQGELNGLFKRRLIGPAKANEPPVQAEVFAVLQRHLGAKAIAVLKQTLPRNLRPTPGER